MRIITVKFTMSDDYVEDTTDECVKALMDGSFTVDDLATLVNGNDFTVEYSVQDVK